MPLSPFVYVQNMSLNAIREKNKILAKISEFTVPMKPLLEKMSLPVLRGIKSNNEIRSAPITGEFQETTMSDVLLL